MAVVEVGSEVSTITLAADPAVGAAGRTEHPLPPHLLRPPPRIHDGRDDDLACGHLRVPARRGGTTPCRRSPSGRLRSVCPTVAGRAASACHVGSGDSARALCD
jgi:hypothetical protein